MKVEECMDRFVNVKWVAQIDEDLHSYNAHWLMDRDIIKPNPGIIGISHGNAICPWSSS
jgi:hypothetical protein